MYDVALSFAGEDRAYVKSVADALRRSGVNVFYDKYETTDLWGKNLYTHLSEIYKNGSRYVVIFISKHYANKVWTNHERESAQARAFAENSEYILPARFDDTKIPGIHETTGYIGLDGLKPAEFARLVAEKVKGEDFWDVEIEEAAHLCSRVFMEAHRGAFWWREGVVALFENRIEDEENPYLRAVRSKLVDLDLIASSPKGTTPIVSFYRSDDLASVGRIYRLVWEEFGKAFGEEPHEKRYVHFEEGIADRVTRTARYLPVKGELKEQS